MTVPRQQARTGSRIRAGCPIPRSGRGLVLLLLMALLGATAVARADGPQITFSSITQMEGNTGLTDFVFTVTLSASSGSEVRVDWTAVDGTAHAPDDYAPSSGTVTFPPGSVEETFVVPVVADRIYEGQEYFGVTLSNPVNGTIGTLTRWGTIQDDDVRGSLASIYQLEGNNGLTDFVFTVTLSGTYEFPVSFDWSTSDATAHAPGDYIASSGTVTFLPDSVQETLVVQVVADRDYEGQEYFSVTLSNPVNGSIGDGTRWGNIQNDDVQGTLATIYQIEGNTGLTDFVFTVTLSGTYEFPVSFDWSTVDATAHAPDDYVASSGTVTFLPGSVEEALVVPVVADRIYENTEYFGVTLSNPVNGSIGTATRWGHIENDDVHASAADVRLPEGDAGTTDFVFTVTLSGLYEFPVSVDWTTADGSARAPGDYLPASGTVTIPDGELQRTLAVEIVGDLIREGDESFQVLLSNPVNGSVGDPVAFGFIDNDDQYPGVSVADVSADEGHEGLTAFAFPLSLSHAYPEEARVGYTTVAGSATPGEDFQPASGMVYFPAGEVDGEVLVQVLGDYEIEEDETFEILLNGPSNLIIADGSAIGTIRNDDLPVDVWIEDTSGWEGDVGTSDFLFDVLLADTTPATVTVAWATADGSAVGGEDYEPSSGVVTFLPGETFQTVAVPVRGDPLDECDETFLVRLSDAVNATIWDDEAAGTIQTDDLLGCADADADCFHDEACGGRDCDDGNPRTHPAAPEANDALDNQCPGDGGYGFVDEISGMCGFPDPAEIAWPAQEDATAYDVARSSVPDFSEPCLLLPPTGSPYLTDPESPVAGEIFFYLVRAASPHVGCWGWSSAGTVRAFTCPAP